MWISTLSGHRRTAGAAAAITAALLAAGPSLAASPAYAADSQTVNFTGGSVLSVLVCKSVPSPSRLTVGAESRVLFVNRLGQTAQLRVDGRSVATVGANQAVPVVFHYGPVSVSMTFGCSAGVAEQFSPASVSVTPRTRAYAPPAAQPGGGSGVVSRGSAATAGAPVRSAPGATRHQAKPDGTGTASAAPDGNPLDPAATDIVPSVDPSGAVADPPFTGGTGGDSTPVAVEPLVPASGDVPATASGLLALVAAVCAVGVTIAATRAIISKRTLQASLA